MMVRNETSSISRPARPWHASSQRVTLMVMAICLAVGILGYLAIQANARERLNQAQMAVLEHAVENINERWLSARDDLLFIASATQMRTFADVTQAGNVDPDGLIVTLAQTPLIELFQAMIERSQGAYLAIRYVTADGWVWSEVSQYDNEPLQRVTSRRLDDARYRDLLQRGLNAGANTYLSTGLVFRTASNSTTLLAPLTPFLRLSAPVNADTNMLGPAGAVQIDLAAQPLLASAMGPAPAMETNASDQRLMVVDSDGAVIADSSAGLEEQLERVANQQNTLLSASMPDVAQTLTEQSEPLRGVPVAGGEVWSQSLALTDTQGTPWRLLLLTGQAASSKGTEAGALALIGSLVLGAGISLVLRSIIRGSLAPLDSANALARQITTGEARPGAIEQGTEAIQAAFTHLQQQVTDLNQSMDARAQQFQRSLEIATRISRETATLRDIDALLQRTISLLCSEFGFYHAQIFLLDDIQAYAVLRYSHGETGRLLLEQGHRLAVGSASVIGQVTARGEAIIVHDTMTVGDTPHQFNPLLPQTRAEMALPMISGGKIVGALDIQSQTPNAFQQNELQIFQLLADQMAIALENARLFVESELRVQQVNRLNREFTQSAWQETIEQQHLQDAYHYDLMQVEPGVPDTDAAAIHRIPISIRGVVIGELSAQADAPLTEGDQVFMRTIADRVGLAIENSRLLTQTQNSLLETYVLYQLSRELGEANSLEDIISATITTVAPEAAGGQIATFVDHDADSTPTQLEVVAAWTRSTAPMTQGMQFQMESHALFKTMLPNQVVLVQDVRRDQRLDDMLRRWLRDTLQAESAVFVPVSVRGQWQGVLTLGFPQARAFNEREGRIFTALIDQAGVAIDNRMLLTQNETSLAQIERLYGGSRVVNMARSAQDIVRAAVVANNDLSLGFELALLEGDLDPTGWPTRMRVVARSIGVEVAAADEVYPLTLAQESQLRLREAQGLAGYGQIPGMTDFAAYMRRNRYEFGVAFPLFSANQPIAVFFIVSEEVAQLRAEDYEIYRALTGQMSVVLQNRYLLEQTAQALDESRRLYEASRAITDAEDAAGVYAAVAQHLSSASQAIQRVSILKSSDPSALRAAYVEYSYVWTRSTRSASDIRTGLRIDQDLVPFGRLVHDRGAIITIQNAVEELPAQGLSGLLAIVERSGSASIMIVSLQTRQKWLGLLFVESDQTEAFSTRLAPFVQAVADQLATALDSLQSFEEAQAQAHRALALAEAGQLANQIGSDLAGSLEAVFSRVAQAANYVLWQLVTVSGDGQSLNEVTRSPAMINSEWLAASYSLKHDRHLIIDAFHQGRPIIVNDPSSYAGYSHLTQAQRTTLGKQIAIPVVLSGARLGALILGRRAVEADLNDRDEQLGLTLASQVAVALENRRLLQASETERETLESILSALPAGVIVLEPNTLMPLQANQQAETLLGRQIAGDLAFTVETYNLHRTGTNVLYPASELPVTAAIQNRQAEFSDDVTVVRPDGSEIDLLVNAAPIVNARGQVTAVIVAFQDISTLRSLENTLQENLRETITLYETTRAFAEAVEIDEVLDLLMLQISMQNVSNAYILMLDEQAGGVSVARSLSGQGGAFPLPEHALDPVQAFFIGDVRQAESPFDDAATTALARQGVAALISLPLRARFRPGAPLGWLVLTFDQPQVFTMEREQSLNTLVESAAVTLDNRYLFRSTQIALDTTASLYKASADISHVQSLEELSTTLQTSLEWLKPDVYAACLRISRRMLLLFSVTPNDNEINFATLLEQHPVTRAVFVDDVRTLTTATSLEQSLIDLGIMRAFGIVPLRLQGRANGHLIVGYRQPHRFEERDTRYLSAVADGASVIADNVLLLDQIQSSLQETSTLYMASRDLTDATNEQDVLKVVVNHLLDRPVSRCFIVSVSGKVLQVDASWSADDADGLDLKGVSLSASQFPAWRILASSDFIMIDDVQEDVRINDLERMSLMSLDLRSVSVLPLRTNERTFGTIIIGHSEPYRHTEREARVYESFAEQASLRLEASRLFVQTERRARQLATSARVSQLASSLEQLERLLPTIVELIKDAFGYDHVQIFLMDDDDRYAVLAASTGEAGEKLLAINHKLEKGSQSVIGRVTATGEPAVALDTADSRVVHRPNPYLPNTRSEMAVALQLKGRVVGALDVQSNKPNFFSEEDTSVLTTLAAQISVAIDNAQLYEQSQARAKDMYFLFTVATAAAGAETLNETLHNVTIALQELLDAASVTMYLPVELTDGEHVRTELHPVATTANEMPLSEVSQVRMEDESNMLAKVASELRPQIIDMVLGKSDYLPVVPNTQSAVIVPLAVGSRLVSVITMESLAPNAYSDDTLTLLLTLSGTLSAIVQNQQLVEELQRTNEKLLELDRIKSDFLANMSHELRTPLNSIIGFSRVILKGIDGPLSEMQEQDLTTIYNSGQHLLNLINDILDQAKIAAGKMDMQADYFDIKPVIDSVRSIGIGLVKDKPIDIVVHVAPGLPKAYGDEFRTRQVLLNLVSNASKFTREGSITISVYPVDDEASGCPMIRADVTDTGIGIAEKDLPLLFEAFRQVDSSLTKTQSGTGLGLPIAKSLMEMQGGSMEVVSQVNVGSTFTIFLPTQPATEPARETKEVEVVQDPPPAINVTRPLDASALPPHIQEQLSQLGQSTAPVSQETEKKPVITPPSVPPRPLHTKRQVLLIEDNPDMVDQFRRTLQRDGFDVYTASIPLEAEAMASGLNPTLIVLDAHFANDSGWGILERLKQRDDTSDIPMIVVGLGEDAERTAQMGVFRFIRKPFMPEALSQAAREAERDAQLERILIIDDEPESARLLQNLLGEAGKYRVYHAVNGVEGVSMVARRRPNLVILDLRMPEMDGFGVIQELRGNPETSSIPIMVVTGDTLNQVEIMRLSELQVIYKPDIEKSGTRRFAEVVKSQLTQINGERK